MPAVMRRRDRRAYRLDLLTRLVEPAERRGLEIGAVGPPTIDPSLGSCQHADFVTTEERARASGSPVETLAPVTIPLTRGQALSEQIPGRFVILHELHRVPDPIGCLDDLTAILEPEGVLLLVIPDKRGRWPAPPTSRESSSGA